MVYLKTKEEIEMMRKAGKILAGIIGIICSKVKAGVELIEIDQLAERLIANAGGRPAFKGYRGYPANICTSLNEVIVHGVPTSKKIKEGDILGLDVGMQFNGLFVDMATTLAIGEITDELKDLLKTAKEALYLGIEQARKDNRLFDISSAIQNYVENKGFSVVRDFVGHGIGRELHEDPEIPNFGKAKEGPLLKEGMTLAIEPMVNMGEPEVEVLDDGWTAVTKDRLPSAHFEHTIAITENGTEILTLDRASEAGSGSG